MRKKKTVWKVSEYVAHHTTKGRNVTAQPSTKVMDGSQESARTVSWGRKENAECEGVGERWLSH